MSFRINICLVVSTVKFVGFIHSMQNIYFAKSILMKYSKQVDVKGKGGQNV